MKYRKTGYDIAPQAPPKRPRAVGIVPDHQIPIFDHKGRMRGRVHAGATSATVARFTGQHGAKLGKKDGRTAWLSPPPPPPKKPEVDPTAVAVAKAQGQSAQKQQTNKLKISLKQAKGSVTDKPSKPETTVRPKRSK